MFITFGTLVIEKTRALTHRDFSFSRAYALTRNSPGNDRRIVVHHLHARHFPFTALVGQEQLRLALILNAINSRIGGVLIRGQKGTAKSTAARGLAEVLPEIEVVTGCP